MITVTYVETKEDILDVKRILGKKGQNIKVLAKI